MQAEIKQLVKQLSLTPHPEGGFYRETYRSDGTLQLGTGVRNYATSIYFLLTSGTFSAFHRIHQDEIWHFHKGSSVTIHLISAIGEYSNITVGADLYNEQSLQAVVPGGTWFGATVDHEDSYSLVGCTVAPGFDFQDFELAHRDELIDAFPDHQKIIEEMTR